MRVNRIAGKRMDSRQSMPAMAMMVAAGWLKPSAHWQDLHTQNHHARDLINAMIETRISAGCIPWASSAGIALASAIRQGLSTGAPPWLPYHDKLIQHLESVTAEGANAKDTANAVNSAETHANNDSLDQMLQRIEEEEALAWLSTGKPGEASL